MDARKLKIAFPLRYDIQHYDPLKVFTDSEAIFLKMIFSNLVDYNQNGELESSLASKFSWDKNILTLTIRENVKTIDGFTITPEDVVFSLKRVMSNQGNTHGNLKAILCGKKEICSNVTNDSQNVYLKLNDIRSKPFVLPLLASIDYSIVPQRIVDAKTNKIADFRNVSGLYYFESKVGGKMIFKVNPEHYRYHKGMPSELVLNVSFGTDQLDLLSKGEVDLVSTVNGIDSSLVEDFIEKHKNLNIHRTEGIRLALLTYTKKGNNTLNRECRLYVGDELRRIYIRKKPLEKMTYEFIPSTGDGSLSRERLNSLKDAFNLLRNNGDIVKRKIRIAVPPGEVEQHKALFSESTLIEIVETQKPPWLLPYEQMPDAYITFTDSSFQENYSLLSYNIAIRSFGLSPQEGESWLDKFLTIENKEERFKYIEDLHYKVLLEGRIVPFTFSSYVALARKPWSFNISQLDAEMPLWGITNN